MNASSPVVIAIPHGSIAIPPSLEGKFRPHVTGGFLRAQSDVFTDQVYALPMARWVAAEWHRFVTDPNRAPNDLRALGVVPTLGFDGRELYTERHRPSLAAIRQRVADYHEPYQRSVAKAVEGASVFIDGHSMAATGPASSLDSEQRRPEACVGNCGDGQGQPLPDDIITCAPEDLRWAGERLGHHLTAFIGGHRPVDVGINRPFRGGYGVRRHAAPGSGRAGIQLELNQGLWWNEEDGLDVDALDRVRGALNAWVEDLSTHCWKQ